VAKYSGFFLDGKPGLLGATNPGVSKLGFGLAAGGADGGALAEDIENLTRA